MTPKAFVSHASIDTAPPEISLSACDRLRAIRADLSARRASALERFDGMQEQHGASPLSAAHTLPESFAAANSLAPHVMQSALTAVQPAARLFQAPEISPAAGETRYHVTNADKAALTPSAPMPREDATLSHA